MSDEKLDLILLELRDFRGEFAELKLEVSGLKQDVSGLKEDVSGLKQEMAELKRDFSEHKEDYRSFKRETSGRLDRHEDLLVQLIGIVKSTNASVARIAEQQTEMRHEFSAKWQAHDYSIDILNREQLKLKADVEMLKNR
ncbi:MULTISPECIES: hypothetical protein [Cohnella]|uniref:hypothetical protein n=1 Tax=Cohnella TaxID=329857 RepID=UPI0009B97BFB|nr:MULTISPECIES: hypothetical protein [Cohnella]MBN2982071.1 hypothetical protein [Cohnella algarum]